MFKLRTLGLRIPMLRYASSEFEAIYSNMEYDSSDFQSIQPRDLTVELLPFQKAGVGWLVDRERRSNGGIMADHLGMGKTVQMLGLCVEAPFHRDSSKPLLKSRTLAEAEAFRVIAIARQFQQIPSIGNCSKITQPGKDLFRLIAEVEAAVQRGDTNFTQARLDIEPWLKFCGRYFPNFEKRARLFVDASTAQHLDEVETDELRTLVVMPAALVHQWESEIRSKVDLKRAAQVAIFHGPRVEAFSTAQLESCDFVLTTYDVLCRGAATGFTTGLAGLTSSTNSSFDRTQASALFQVRWKRIVLDEAHVIRNPATLRWKAVDLLESSKRWAVTATPLHNSILDLQTLMKFTGNPSLPIHKGTTGAAANDFVIRDRTMQRSIARALMPTMLRRAPIQKSKSGATEVLVTLPEKIETVVELTFTDQEATQYNDILARSKSQLANTNREKITFHVFAMMTRLRQACLHSSLHQGKSLEVYLCGACKNQAIDVVLTKCGHAFCYECIAARFQEASATEQAVRIPCPECHHPIPSSVFAKRVSASQRLHQLRSKPFVASTKVDAVLKHIQRIRDEYPMDKVVVFSQFTGMLDVLTVGLERVGFDCCRLDGSMTLEARAAVTRNFQSADTVRVLLASKFAVGVGLNLTAANHVIVTDPWWNPAMEEQAVHRCHRIGQKKNVHVSRFVIKESIEDYCFGVAQKKKRFGDAILSAVSDENFVGTSQVLNDITHLNFVKTKPGA